MAANIKFLDTSASIDGTLSNVLVVSYAGNKFEAVPEQLHNAIGSNGLEALKHLAETCQPGLDSGSSVETFVKTQDGFQRLCLCLLPKVSPSRHAAHGHPHSIADLVRSNKGKEAPGSSVFLSIFLVLKDPELQTFAAACSIARAFHTYSQKSSKDESKKVPEVVVYTCADKCVYNKAAEMANFQVNTSELDHIAKNIQACASLIDMPPNELNCDAYVAYVQEAVKDFPDVSIDIIRGKELEEQGFGGIYGVGKASIHPPALVILSYQPDVNKKSVCLIGKGITYDTGGLSIKTKTGMPGMKRDMGGSAGVLCGFLSLVSSGGIGRPFHCLLCLAENSVAGNATRPDDVHTFYSKKTVEINNTDAEGRLVMADGLAYAAQNLNPNLLINMATLTGAQGVATGTKHAAIFTNKEELENLAVKCGRLSGDLTHPLPYTPEFFRPEFKSAVADMKNSQKNRGNCGSGAPATFLSNHIESYLKQESDNDWLHIDMASPAYSGERATGYGVALLFCLLKSYTS